MDQSPRLDSSAGISPDNPHAAPLERGVEMDSRLALIRRGWKPATLKVGDKIKVVISPLREGQRGGLLVRVTL